MGRAFIIITGKYLKVHRTILVLSPISHTTFTLAPEAVPLNHYPCTFSLQDFEDHPDGR